MPPPLPPRELIRRHLDGLATPAERAELEELLRTRPEVADQLARASRFDADLTDALRDSTANTPLRHFQKHLERRRQWRRGAVAALVVLAAGVLFALFGPRRPRPPIEDGPHRVVSGTVLVSGRPVPRLGDGVA